MSKVPLTGQVANLGKLKVISATAESVAAAAAVLRMGWSRLLPILCHASWKFVYWNILINIQGKFSFQYV